jgi:hypothetical protein
LKGKNAQALQGSWEVPDAARQAADALLEWRIADAGHCARNAARLSVAWSHCLAQSAPEVSEAERQAVRQVSAAQQTIAAELEALAQSPAAQGSLVWQLEAQQRDVALRLEQELSVQAATLRLLELGNTELGNTESGNTESGNTESGGPPPGKTDSAGGRPSAAQVEEAARQFRQARDHLHAAQSHSRLGDHDQAIEAGEQAVTQWHRVRDLIRQTIHRADVAESSESTVAGDVTGQLVRTLDQLRSAGPPVGSQAAASMKSLRAAAHQLHQAAWQMGVSPRVSDETPLLRQQSGQESAYSSSSDALASPFLGEIHLSPQESAFSTGSREVWGQLPATFQTQLFQSAHRASPPDYREWIEQYFETLTGHSLRD